MEESLIIFCPCCCTNLDAIGKDGEVLSQTCSSCDTEFTVTVDLTKFAQHSMFG